MNEILVEDAVLMEPGAVHGKACYTSCSVDDVLKIERLKATCVVAVAVCQGKAAAPAPAIAEKVANFVASGSTGGGGAPPP